MDAEELDVTQGRVTVKPSVDETCPTLASATHVDSVELVEYLQCSLFALPSSSRACSINVVSDDGC